MIIYEADKYISLVINKNANKIVKNETVDFDKNFINSILQIFYRSSSNTNTLTSNTSHSIQMTSSVNKKA